MIIQSNVNAMFAQRQASKPNKSAERLSTGYKLNRAADNPAGLVISEEMRAQIRGLSQAGENAQDGISLIKTAEGAMGDIESLLHRIRELSVQSANDTNTDEDRESMNMEVQALITEIDRIAEDTEFNTMKLLNGDRAGNRIGKPIDVKLAGMLDIPGAFWTVDYLIDLSDMEDGAVIEIDGVNFEFDMDGVINDVAAISVDVNGADNKQRGERFVDAVALSPLNVKYDDITSIADLNLPLTFVLVKFGTVTDHYLTSKPAAGKPGNPLNLQIGPLEGDSIEVAIDQMSIRAIGIDMLNVLDGNAAGNAISIVDSALNRVSEARAGLGAVQNRIEHAINNIGVYEENLSNAESRIRDTNMAKEAMEYYKHNIIVESAQSMLAQACKQPEGAIKLLE